MSDALALGLTIVGFAALVTVHFAIAASLAMRTPRWHALLALFVPLTAPFLAARAGARGRAVVWVVAAIGYGVGQMYARR